MYVLYMNCLSHQKVNLINLCALSTVKTIKCVFGFRPKVGWVFLECLYVISKVLKRERSKLFRLRLHST